MAESIVEMMPCGSGDQDIVPVPRRKSLVRFTSTEETVKPRAITRIPTRIELTTLTRMAKRPAVDIEFQDLSYTVGQRRIIKNISGIFKSGQLTAIMGPSGAGKSTLMDILVGYVTNGVTGSIITNGHPRQLKFFNKLCSYIMQEDLLQPNLTVRENMQIAAHLKLGNELSASDRDTAVTEILKTLSLSACSNIRTERLSGGQKKRLAVALELVNNPPVIFLDEPTTGLDIVAINNCIQLLKDLSRQGRTIVCTIHQPSASLFHMFDLVYVLARGCCVYQGSSNQLVPFLANCGLHCPPTYNPADYVLEVLQMDVINMLTTEIQNGKIIKLDQKNKDEPPRSKLCRMETVAVMPNVYGADKHAFDFPTSSWEQFSILLRRMTTQRFRNSTALWLQIIHHIFSGVIIGTIFWGVGNNASKPFENFKFCLCVSVFMMYTYVMTPVLILPLEVNMLKREFFNRWYGLKAFYFARSASTLPTTVVLVMVFNSIVYLMSNQPLEVMRFLWFCTICLALATVSEGLGILIGIMFNCTNGAVVGPSVMAPILMLSMHGMGYGEKIMPAMHYLMNLSFLRLALVGIITCLYTNGREPLMCQGEVGVHPYCHYKDPSMLVRDLGMKGQSMQDQLLGMIGYLLLFRTAALFVMRLTLTTDIRSRIIEYIHKIIKQT